MASWYRKTDIRMWGDRKFRELSPLQPGGQALWMYLLTGPHTRAIPGLYISGEAGMAEALGWSLKAFREAFREASGKGMAKGDWEGRVILVPRAIRYNVPESPNVVRSWVPHFEMVPESPLKDEWLLRANAYFEGEFKGSEAFGEAFREAFGEALGKALAQPSPNQEQEQEQEQEQDKNVLSGKPDLTPKPDFEAIVGYLNLKAGTRFKAGSEKTRRLIKARFNEGFRVEDFQEVIDRKAQDWLTDPEMAQYLRPETLFGTKFEGYLNGRQGGKKLTVAEKNAQALERVLAGEAKGGQKWIE